MINALGFTSEEGDILEGYCDKVYDNDYSATLLLGFTKHMIIMIRIQLLKTMK